MGLVLIGAFVVIGGYLIHSIMGPEFIINEIPFFLFAAVVLLVLRLKSWFPVAFLLIQVPIQGFLVQQFGLKANFLSLLPILAVLSQIRPEQMIDFLFGTNTQKLAGLFIIGMVVSVAVAELDLNTFVAFGQKATLFLIIPTVFFALKRDIDCERLAWITLLSVGTVYFLSEAGYYFGRELIPISGTGTGLTNLELHGDSLNQVPGLAGFAGSVGQNRFAFQALLPIALGFGLFAKGYSTRFTLLVVGMLAILSVGLIVTGSRSGTLGAVVVIAVIQIFMPRASSKFRISMMVAVLGVIGAGVLWYLPNSVTAIDRYFRYETAESSYYHESGFNIDQGRLSLWNLGFDMFKTNPVTGVGLLQFRNEVRYRLPSAEVATPHSGFVQIAAETGLVGGVPFFLLITYCLVNLYRRFSHESGELRLWKIIFLGAFVGMIVDVIFGTYHFDRYFWIPIAFSAYIDKLKSESKISNRAETRSVFNTKVLAS